MQIAKQVVTHLTKCYSLSEINYQNDKVYLVTSEKNMLCQCALPAGGK